MFYYYQSGQDSVAGLGGSTLWSLTPPGGCQWASIGWQNSASATDLYASQMFLSTGGTGYIQLVNTSFTSTNVWLYGVYASTDATDLAVAAKITTMKREQGKPQK